MSTTLRFVAIPPFHVLKIMNTKRILALLAFSALLSGCYSGFTIVQIGGGEVIEYEELRKKDSGSLSTVWYQGSDESYHHFVHFIKTSTKYRVKREEIEINNEFPKGKRSVHLMELSFEKEAFEKRINEINRR